MMDVEIRPLNPKDYGKAIDFAIQGIHFERYVQNRLALRLYGRYFLYLELARATQVLAAYVGERLVGVLMADMNGEAKHHSSLWQRQYVKLFGAMMALAVRGGPDVYDRANEEMLREFLKTAKPDGELCFLAADPAMQGKGIGTRLLNELGRREAGRCIYLYTDDNCNVQFYEKRGFVCAQQRNIHMQIGSNTVPLACLLYSKRL